MLEAGRTTCASSSARWASPIAELIKIAVKSMGLDELGPFDPNEKIIEYAMRDHGPEARLVDLTIEGFTHETASESPAPGGGSVAAALGAMGAALGTMVANSQLPSPWLGRSLGGVLRARGPRQGLPR
jgi:glutamate formiminotransferase/formiminotetrahydrofolate cyclodeaminase